MQGNEKLSKILYISIPIRIFQVLGEISFVLSILLIPFIAAFLFDIILAQGAKHLYPALLLVSALTLFIIILLGICLDFLEVHMEEECEKNLSLKIFQSLLRSAYPMGVHYNFSQVTEVLEKHIKIVAPLGNKINRSIGHILQLTTICTLLFTLEKNLAFLVLLGIPLYLLENYLSPFLSSYFFKKEEPAQPSIDFHPIVKKISLIRALGNESTTLKDIENHLYKKMTHTIKTRLISNIEALSSSLLLKIWVTLVIAYLGYHLVNAQISLGASALFFLNFIFIQSPLNHLRFLFQERKRIKVSLKEIHKILSLTQFKQDQGQIELSHFAPTIKFESVTLLPKDMGFLNTSLFIEAGSKNVIINQKNDRSWAWANLLLKLQNLESGSVYIDKDKIQDIKIESLQSHVGILFDDVDILEVIIEEIFQNKTKKDLVDSLVLRLGLESWKQRYLYHLSNPAAPKLNLDRLTRFKINLIRIYLQTPQILIIKNDFDWIPEVDRNIIRTILMEISQDCTVVHLSEDIQSIKSADKIFFFDGNQLMEEGNFAELLEKRSHFYHFFHQKFGDLRDFLERLNLELRRSDRYSQNICLSMIQIEGFDFIESSFPEESLQVFDQVQNMIRKELRINDFSTFLNLHTFALCTPETSLSDTQIALGRITNRIEKNIFSVGNKNIQLKLSQSILEYDRKKNTSAQDFISASLDHLQKQAVSYPKGISPK